MNITQLEKEIIRALEMNENVDWDFSEIPIKQEFKELKIVNFYSDVKWYFPKVKNGQLLSVPITTGDQPLCAYFIKEISRQCEVIEYSKLM